MQCQNPDTTKFCPKCGNKSEGVMQEVKTKKCPSCSAENPVSAKFCKVDGYNFQQAGKKPEEKPIEEKPKDEILCPKCGTSYPLTVKFCKKDGTLLQALPSVSDMPKKPEPVKEEIKPEMEKKPVETGIRPAAETGRAPVNESKPPAPTFFKKGAEGLSSGISDVKPAEDVSRAPAEEIKEDLPEAPSMPDMAESKEAKLKTEAKEQKTTGVSKAIAWAAVAVVVFIAAGAGGYFYLSNKKDTKTTAPSAKQEPPQEAAQPSKPETAKETPPQQTEVVKEPEKVAEKAQPQPETLSKKAKPPVEKKTGVTKPDKRLIAPSDPEPKTVRPEEPKQAEEEKAQKKEIAMPSPPHQPQPQKIDPAKLEGDINRALRNAGLKSISAEVTDNFVVVLKGVAASRAEKDTAFEIAEKFKDVRKTKDRILIVDY